LGKKDETIDHWEPQQNHRKKTGENFRGQTPMSKLRGSKNPEGTGNTQVFASTAKKCSAQPSGINFLTRSNLGGGKPQHATAGCNSNTRHRSGGKKDMYSKKGCVELGLGHDPGEKTPGGGWGVRGVTALKLLYLDNLEDGSGKSGKLQGVRRGPPNLRGNRRLKNRSKKKKLSS